MDALPVTKPFWKNKMITDEIKELAAKVRPSIEDDGKSLNEFVLAAQESVREIYRTDNKEVPATTAAYMKELGEFIRTVPSLSECLNKFYAVPFRYEVLQPVAITYAGYKAAQS